MSQQDQTIENQEQALGVLIQGTQLAQSRGAFKLHEASLLSQAVGFFVPEQPAEEEKEESE